MDFIHQPIMTDEIINFFDYFREVKKPILLDGTLGLGGHSGRLLRSFANLKIIGIDRDTGALAIAKNRLKVDQKRVFLTLGRFEEAKKIIFSLGFSKIDGALLDLGVSSMQLDDHSRGFSFLKDSGLDMRMDQGQILDAQTVVNDYQENQLVEIFSKYGEERFSKTIAREIVRYRQKRKITRTTELAEIVKNSIPKGKQFSKTHPATNVFRAIRMEVNNEVSDLGQAIIDIFNYLDSGARLAIITFHSIEDRIVKQTFRQIMADCLCPPRVEKCSCGKKSEGVIITKRPIVPTTNEINSNPRSRSAKLRVIEKI